MPNPSKELFYRSVYKLLNKKNYNKTLDIGCGHLDLYKNINTKEYHGIDILDYNLKMGENAYYEKIDFNNYRTKNKFDLIVIHNTINYNGDYDVKKFENNLLKMSSMLSENGYISFNFGNRNENFFEKINHIVLNEHRKYGLNIVKSFNYGLFHFPLNKFLYKIILITISIFPFIDRNHLSQKFKYFLLKKIKT